MTELFRESNNSSNKGTGLEPRDSRHHKSKKEKKSRGELLFEEPKTETPYLDLYTENLTEKIRKDIENFEVYGRDKEVENVIISLLRKNKNSPLLVGDPGVGKTAIVEGLAARILRGEVPDEFKGVSIRSLELSSILNDSNGENMVYKFKKIIEELKATVGKNILFMDEVHTLVGAGGNGSMLDAGNVIKPALSRGEIQIISATTLEEYHLSIETDKALERRVQMIPVDEPTRDDSIYILSKISKRYEKGRNITVTPEAIRQAVDLSIRFIPERYLPDKAIDLVDEAVAAAYYNKQSLVTEKEIALVVEKLKDIPMTTILSDRDEPIVNVFEALKKRVKGQDKVLRAVSRTIYTAREGLQNPTRPTGTFLFLGPTGVGKTELAKAIAEVMFGDENAMIRLDCSEYSTADSLERLIGGNFIGSKGILTEKVKVKPYSVVLFDELEKAHKLVWDVLLQVLDDGRLTTGLGRQIDFKNTIIIATSNAGLAEIMKTYHTKGNISSLNEYDYQDFMKGMETELEIFFRPEFLARFRHKLVFDLLTPDIIDKITLRVLDKEKEIFSSQGIELVYDEPTFLDYLRVKGTDVDRGARPLEGYVENNVRGPIAEYLHLKERKGRPYRISIEVVGKKPDGITTTIDRRQLEFEAEPL